MQFPQRLVIGPDHFECKQVRNGVLYTRAHSERPYVFIPDALLDDARSFYTNGIYRARISQSHRAAEFQRGAPHPYTVRDEMVTNAHIDAETREFGRAFWVAISLSGR